MGEGLAKTAAALGAAPMELARNGKPLKASPERIAAIRDSIRKGLTIDKACILHGVHRSMLEKWKKANESILQLFEQAELANEEELIGFVRNAAPEDYKAAAWLLERRHQWILATRSEHTGKDGGPMQVLAIHKELLSRIASKPDLDAMKRADVA